MLALEVVVERRPVDADRVGDVAERRGAVALGQERLAGGGDDLLAPGPVGGRRLRARARPPLAELGAVPCPPCPLMRRAHRPRPQRCQRGDVGGGHRSQRHRRGRVASCTAGASQPSRRSRVLSIFMLASLGSSASTRTKLGTHFGTEVGLRRHEVVELVEVEGVGVVDLDRDHHPVADRVVGHRVHRGRPHARVRAARSRSTGAAAKFSPSTRSHSFERPAKKNQPSASRYARSPDQ